MGMNGVVFVNRIVFEVELVLRWTNMPYTAHMLNLIRSQNISFQCLVINNSWYSLLAGSNFSNNTNIRSKFQDIRVQIQR